MFSFPKKKKGNSKKEARREEGEGRRDEEGRGTRSLLVLIATVSFDKYEEQSLKSIGFMHEDDGRRRWRREKWVPFFSYQSGSSCI